MLLLVVGFEMNFVWFLSARSRLARLNVSVVPPKRNRFASETDYGVNFWGFNKKAPAGVFPPGLDIGYESQSDAFGKGAVGMSVMPIAHLIASMNMFWTSGRS